MFSSTSRLECLGKSSTSSKQQLAIEVHSAQAETRTSKDTERRKTVTDKQWSLPVHKLPRSIQKSPKSQSSLGRFASSSVKNLTGDDFLPSLLCDSKESINTTPRVEEQAELAAETSEGLNMKAESSKLTGSTLASPPVEHLHTHEANEEEEDSEDDDLPAPVELLMEFLGAVMDKDFQLASKLCHMILIYEPDNPEASEFLPLIEKRLQEEREAEESDDDDEDDDDDSEDNGGDKESSQSSNCSSSSCSSTSPSDDDEEQEHQSNRQKPPPPLISP